MNEIIFPSFRVHTGGRGPWSHSSRRVPVNHWGSGPSFGAVDPWRSLHRDLLLGLRLRDRASGTRQGRCSLKDVLFLESWMQQNLMQQNFWNFEFFSKTLNFFECSKIWLQTTAQDCQKCSKSSTPCTTIITLTPSEKKTNDFDIYYYYYFIIIMKNNSYLNLNIAHLQQRSCIIFNFGSCLKTGQHSIFVIIRKIKKIYTRMLDTTNWWFYIHYGAIFSLLES